MNYNGLFSQGTVIAMAVPVTILLSVANRARGGWPSTGHTQLARGINALAIALAAWIASGHAVVAALMFVFSWPAMVIGWGSYTDLGRNAIGYRDRKEFVPIDWLLARVFGCDWVPAGETWTPDMIARRGFDLAESPAGETIRPFAWRARRDLAGLCLRGLVWSVSIGAGIAIAAALGYVSWWALAYVAVGPALGVCYAAAYAAEDDLPLWYGDCPAIRGATDFAEFLWGYVHGGAFYLAVGMGAFAAP